MCAVISFLFRSKFHGSLMNSFEMDEMVIGERMRLYRKLLTKRPWSLNKPSLSYLSLKVLRESVESYDWWWKCIVLQCFRFLCLSVAKVSINECFYSLNELYTNLNRTVRNVGVAVKDKMQGIIGVIEDGLIASIIFISSSLFPENIKYYWKLFVKFIIVKFMTIPP